MKKHILLGAALLSLFAASCSNDDVIDNGTEVVTGKTISLNASINNGADTRLTYDDDGSSKITVAWSNSEKFTMYKGTNNTGSEFSNSADATDTFKGDDIEGDGTYYAVYGSDITNTDGTLTIDLSQAQVGTAAENGIKEFMLATASELNSSTTLAFDHKLTVLKMTLTLPNDVTGTVSMVTVSGLHNKASYALSNDSYAYADDNKGDITATNGEKGFFIDIEHTITAYVAVFPENVSANQVTIKATVGDDEYSYTIASARTLPENKVVPVQVTLAAPKTNFKSEYTADDYKTWSDENCKNAPTAEEMKMYLGAGVYWDAGTDNTDGNQQTYTVNGSEYHAGLWVMKKAYIDGVSASSAKAVNVVSSSTNSDCWHTGRPDKSEIGKYFFLPAAGFYYYSFFTGVGSNGIYWSCSSVDSDDAYCLGFSSSSALVVNDSRGLGYLPMAAE